MKSGKLASKGFFVLKAQFDNAKGSSRSEMKAENNGRYADYRGIYSKLSLVQHQSQFKAIANWLEAEKGIKTLKKIQYADLVDYLKYCHETGLSEKTLKSRVTAINHVMVGSKVWEAQQAISLKKLRESGAIISQKGASWVYKDLTASEWRERHTRAYRNNKDLIDIARAFGLRRGEILGKSVNGYAGVTFSNIGYFPGSKKLFIETIGKGGKYRVAPVREDMAKEMWEKYGTQAKEYSRSYFDKPLSERVAILKAETQKAQKLFKNSKSHIPLHINRNEYVEKLLKERQEKHERRLTAPGGGGIGGGAGKIGYSKIGFKSSSDGSISLYKTEYKDGEQIISPVDPYSVVKIGTWVGYVIAAAEVMRAIGHNRLDVLLKYLK